MEIEVREGGLQAAPANKEMLELLVAYLPKHFPDRFVHTEDNHFLNLATGDDFDLNDPELDPLEVSALLVQVCSMPSITKSSSPLPSIPRIQPPIPISVTLPFLVYFYSCESADWLRNMPHSIHTQ